MTVLEITYANLTSIPARWGNALATLAGVAAVICVLASTTMMSRSLQTTVENSHRENWGIIVREGAVVESMSSIPRSSFDTLSTFPALAETRLIPHFVTNVTKPRIENPTISSSVLVRGIPASYPAPPLNSGRLPASGRHELIVGRWATEAFTDLADGGEVLLNGVTWVIVGTFDAPGTAASELRADLTSLMDTFKSTSISSIRVDLTNHSVDELKDAIASDKRLRLDLHMEADFFAVGTSAVLFSIIATSVSAIMALGAVIAAISLMFASIEIRKYEIATLRAIGFSAPAIGTALMAEAIVLCLAGGALGLAFASLLFGGTTYTSGHMSSIVTPVLLTSDVAIQALIWSLLLGVTAGIFPAITASRRSVVEGLRWEG